MIRKLKLFLDYRKTPLEITTTIVSGVESSFDGNNNKQKDSELTWWDFIQGRLDTQWEKTLDDSYHLRGIHSAKTFNGESWCKNTIIWLWSRWHELWKIRNDQVYSKNNDENFQREHTTNRIKYLYSLGPKLSTHDRDMFLGVGLETLLERKTRALKDWLITTEDAILVALQQAEQQIKETHREISTYFTWHSTNKTQFYITTYLILFRRPSGWWGRHRVNKSQ